MKIRYYAGTPCFCATSLKVVYTGSVPSGYNPVFVAGVLVKSMQCCIVLVEYQILIVFFPFLISGKNTIVCVAQQTFKNCFYTLLPLFILCFGILNSSIFYINGGSPTYIHLFQCVFSWRSNNTEYLLLGIGARENQQEQGGKNSFHIYCYCCVCKVSAACVATSSTTISSTTTSSVGS